MAYKTTKSGDSFNQSPPLLSFLHSSSTAFVSSSLPLLLLSHTCHNKNYDLQGLGFEFNNNNINSVVKMAASCFSASSSLEIAFLRPETASNKLRFSISRRNALRKLNLGSRIRALKREEVVVVEKEDGKIDLGGNGSYKYVNGKKNSNGSVVGENESLIKYVNSNGNGNGGIGMKIGEDVVEKKKKKTIEEIGQEDAWFKRSGEGNLGKVEVYV